VAALRAFQKAIIGPGGRLNSWQATVDPCGWPSCSIGTGPSLPYGPHTSPGLGMAAHHNSSGLPGCNYYGVGCNNWRIDKLVLSCFAAESPCPELQGVLPDDIGNLTGLSVLDLQVKLVIWHQLSCATI